MSNKNKLAGKYCPRVKFNAIDLKVFSDPEVRLTCVCVCLVSISRVVVCSLLRVAIEFSRACFSARKSFALSSAIVYQVFATRITLGITLGNFANTFPKVNPKVSTAIPALGNFWQILFKAMYNVQSHTPLQRNSIEGDVATV